MVSSHSTPAPDAPPPPVTPGGTYNIQVRPLLLICIARSDDSRARTDQTVSVGCKLYIRRPAPDGQTEERLAEILSIREKPQNSYARQQTVNDGSVKPEDNLEFFVHWEHFNKRLDEWVSGSRLVTTRDLEWPRPKAPPGKKNTPV